MAVGPFLEGVEGGGGSLIELETEDVRGLLTDMESTIVSVVTGRFLACVCVGASILTDRSRFGGRARYRLTDCRIRLEMKSVTTSDFFFSFSPESSSCSTGAFRAVADDDAFSSFLRSSLRFSARSSLCRSSCLASGALVVLLYLRDSSASSALGRVGDRRGNNSRVSSPLSLSFSLSLSLSLSFSLSLSLSRSRSLSRSLSRSRSFSRSFSRSLSRSLSLSLKGGGSGFFIGFVILGPPRTSSRALLFSPLSAELWPPRFR